MGIFDKIKGLFRGKSKKEKQLNEDRKIDLAKDDLVDSESSLELKIKFKEEQKSEYITFQTNDISKKRYC